MFGFSRIQILFLFAALFIVALSAAIQYAGASFAPPLVLVRAQAIEPNDGDLDGALPDGNIVRTAETSQARPDTGNPDDNGAGLSRDLNRMSFDDLLTLPGIGPVLAERILAYRVEHGGFERLDQLLDVKGIGQVKYGRLLSLVTLGPRVGAYIGPTSLAAWPGRVGARPTTFTL